MHLRTNRRVSTAVVKLSYVVRERLIAAAGEVFGRATPPYESHDDELTNRYPIIAGELGFDATQTEDQMTELEKMGLLWPGLYVTGKSYSIC